MNDPRRKEIQRALTLIGEAKGILELAGPDVGNATYQKEPHGAIFGFKEAERLLVGVESLELVPGRSLAMRKTLIFIVILSLFVAAMFALVLVMPFRLQ